jgi:hypothetical protein
MKNAIKLGVVLLLMGPSVAVFAQTAPTDNPPMRIITPANTGKDSTTFPKPAPQGYKQCCYTYMQDLGYSSAGYGMEYASNKMSITCPPNSYITGIHEYNNNMGWQSKLVFELHCVKPVTVCAYVPTTATYTTDPNGFRVNCP